MAGGARAHAAACIPGGGARGAWPRSKRSTMTIGAPQQGHRRALSLKCSSAPASPVMTGTAMSGDSGAASSARARVSFAIRLALASRP
jgi:hypothetical protein